MREILDPITKVTESKQVQDYTIIMVKAQQLAMIHTYVKYDTIQYKRNSL